MHWKSVFAAFAALVMLLWSGTAHAARFFVDNTLGDVPAEQAAAVSEPQPVQLIFQFTTSGAANARATRFLTERITEQVRTSGFFSEVSTGPVASGAILSVRIDNIPQADAASRGFGTGLTFGLIGTSVADYYVATVEYVSGPDAQAISKEARHTLITTIGNTDAPENATRARNADEAVGTIVRQLLAHTLNGLASDADFPGSAAAAAAAAATPPEATPTEAAATADVTAAADTAPVVQPEPAPAN